MPGDLEESLLIAAIRYRDEALQMPPKAKLPDEVIADFEAWVMMGAPDPRGVSSPASVASKGLDIEKGRQFWAFQPPRAVSPPAVKDASWPRTDIDRFLLNALEDRGLKPVADAHRHALIRRVSFDLVGLPPAPEEVEAFVADESPEAFAKVVDRLLASARFGERWGRHWLDVARYAESSGKANMMYPQAWRYRDWVIAAFNADMPYDQFVQHQIAGDLLPARDAHGRAEQTIATGFLALGSKTHNTQNRKQFLVDLADEQIEVTSHAFLGLTVACARCHDHKFDPIPQRDYYALSGIFQSTQTCYGTLPGIIQNANPSPLIELPDDSGVPSAVPDLPPGASSPAGGPTGRADQDPGRAEARGELPPQGVPDPGPGGDAPVPARVLPSRRHPPEVRDGGPRAVRAGREPALRPGRAGAARRAGPPRPGPGALPGDSPPISEGSGRRELARWLVSRARTR